MDQTEQPALEKIISDDGTEYAPVIQTYEFHRDGDYYDGYLSGTVLVEGREYFYYFCDGTAEHLRIFRVIELTQAEMDAEIAQANAPDGDPGAQPMEERFVSAKTVGYILW